MAIFAAFRVLYGEYLMRDTITITCCNFLNYQDELWNWYLNNKSWGRGWFVCNAWSLQKWRRGWNSKKLAEGRSKFLAYIVVQLHPQIMENCVYMATMRSHAVHQTNINLAMSSLSSFFHLLVWYVKLLIRKNKRITVALLEAVVSCTFFVAGNEWGRDLYEGKNDLGI